MVKGFGSDRKIIHQVCLKHAIHLGFCDVLYKEAPEETIEDYSF